MMNKILIVDDDALLLDGLKRVIGKGYEVVSTTSCLEALQMLAHGDKFSTIISDMNMPGMNGVQFLEKVGGLVPEVPRVMLTGYADMQVMSASINQASVFRFLEKPFAKQDLLGCLADCDQQYEINRMKIEEEDLNADELWISNELTKVDFRNDLELLFQPRITSSSETTVGVEALLRWRHPTEGQISPARFIPVAERTQSISDITRWVTLNACKAWSDWKMFHGISLSISVNVPPSLFQGGGLHDMVSECLSKYSVDPSCLELEITEGTQIQNIDHAMETITSLKSLGITVAIDDFGAGYTSMSYLQNIDLDCVKIDRKFVANAPTQDKDKEILRGVVNLTNALGLKVVAEGVETAKHVEIVHELGIDEMQGFYYAKPMSSKDLLIWLSLQSSNKSNSNLI